MPRLFLSFRFGLATASFTIVLALELQNSFQILGGPTTKLALTKRDRLRLLKFPACQPSFQRRATDTNCFN